MKLYGHGGLDLGADRSGYLVWQADLDTDIGFVNDHWNVNIFPL